MVAGRGNRLALLAWLGAVALHGETVRIGVFGLFHPAEVSVRAGGSGVVRIAGGQGVRTIEGREQVVVAIGWGSYRVAGRDGGPAAVYVGVPGKIERRFTGTISIMPRDGEFTIVVEMDREAAVASIVAAELAPGTPLEALKAQAVVTRSFLAASPGRHVGYDFCDTTHCQFLRAAPERGSDAARAAVETEGLVLWSEGRRFVPLYSAACGGRTRVVASGGYAYRAVTCEYCRRARRATVRGHRYGMCQEGAIGMAKEGETFRRILDYYYPATVVGRR